MSNRHKSVRIVFFCAAYGTESLSVLFLLGFYKKRQKYWTLSKEFWGLLLHPKENMSKNIINALLFLYYWKRSRTDDWEENLTNMFHYSGNYLPRNTEWSVKTCRVACSFENRSQHSGPYCLLPQWSKWPKFVSFHYWCAPKGARGVKKSKRPNRNHFG